MAGIYIHIPFCRKACHYCDFHFSTSTSAMQQMVAAIQTELTLQQSYLHEPVETLYFGGGTPSLLSIVDLENIIGSVKQNFTLVPDAEITLEANPDDISIEKARDWKKIGINRLSIGIQSFFEEDLRWMNRAHNGSQAIDCIHHVKEAGFDNITIDLIYGTPSLTDEQWKYNFDTAVSFGINHLSCYALTVEPDTALAKMIRMQKAENVDSEKQARHFSLLMDWSAAAGYEQYEISNFAKPGFRSRHNSAYWQGKAYLGIGPSAHSFNGNSRKWNIANNALYMKSVEAGVIPAEEESLTEIQQLNEYLMTGLRTMEGVSLTRIKETWGEQYLHEILGEAAKFMEADQLQLKDDSLSITNKGRFLADGIAAELFIINNKK